MQDIPIRDIKPLVQIPDYSIFLFSAVVFISLLIVISLIIFLFKYLKNRRDNLRKSYLKALKNIDFSNPKESAYEITKYAKLLVKDERSMQIYEDLTKRLEVYKYRKDVPQIDNEVKKYYNLFIEVVNGWVFKYFITN